MKILTIDIGNSETIFGCVDKHQVVFSERMSSDSRKTYLEYVILCKMLLELHHVEVESLDGAILSSVVPPLTDLLEAAIEKLTGIHPLIVKPGMKTGLDIHSPEIGSDVVVGAVAAISEYGAPVIVIDMGTATTLTVIDKDRLFRGGVILPGVQLALRSLETGAAQLPGIRLSIPQRVIHLNTIDSMQSGVIYGNAGALDGLLDRITEELGYPAQAVASGSLASLILPCCRHKITVDDDLLLKGLDILYQKNHEYTA